jgi:hypothetical protein
MVSYVRAVRALFDRDFNVITDIVVGPGDFAHKPENKKDRLLVKKRRSDYVLTYFSPRLL